MRIVSIRNILNQWNKKIMPKGANKISRLMGLIIMQANKKCKSNRLLRIFERSNSILKTIVEYLNQLGMTGYSVSARIYLKGVFMWQTTARQ